jgi:hypothetical protein
MKGVGPFLHIDPDDRPPGRFAPSLFAPQNTLHFSKDPRPYLLLPIIPEQ